MGRSAAPWHISNLEVIVARFQPFLPLKDSPQTTRTQELLEKHDKGKEAKDKNPDLTVSEIFELDSALHRLLPTQALLEELPMLRLRYKEAIGERQYAAYKPFDPGPSPNLNDSQLRSSVLADTEIVLSGLYREYALSTDREGLRQKFAQTVINALGIYTAIWTVLLGAWTVLLIVRPHMGEQLRNYRWLYLPVFLTVCYFGIVGGYISFLRRTQSLPIDSDALLAIQEQNSVRDLLWSSPLLGAVFAIILLLLFRGDLLSGGLFPKFGDSLVPTGIENYAKLCFWSFVAGFAERFVPGVLDRIIQKSGSPAKANSGRTTAKNQ